jgi:Spy/CpxP family protein refolding chaperone
MKSLVAAFATAVLAAGAGLYVAQEAQGKDQPSSAESLAARLEDPHLTEAQEEQIENVRKEYGPKVQAAAKALGTLVKEEMEKARAVLTPGQRTKLQEMKEERKERRIDGLAAKIAHLRHLDLTDDEVEKIQAIRKDFRPKIRTALKNMEGLLSAEQKEARVEGLKAGKTRREVLAALKFTGAQKEKMQSVCQEVGALVREELKEIRNILTEEQKARLVELKDERRDRIRDRMVARIANLKDLELTDDQKAKLVEIRREYRPRIHEAGNQLRAAIREEVGAIINAFKE